MDPSEIQATGNTSTQAQQHDTQARLPQAGIQQANQQQQQQQQQHLSSQQQRSAPMSTQQRGKANPQVGHQDNGWSHS